jgi:Uma2 family endonuclease
MSALPNTPKLPMTVTEFLNWNTDNVHGRFELFCGEPVKMQSERARHADTKGNAYIALKAAVRAAKVPCHVFPDGMTVVINDDTCYEPDAIVTCGPKVDPDSVTVDEPAIVVEVGSPATQGFDMGQKLADYLTVPSISHVLLIDPRKKRAILHTRKSESEWATRVFAANERVKLDPPGIGFDLAECFVEA